MNKIKDAESALRRIFDKVARKQNLVTPEYVSVGGKWPTETYKLHDVVCKIMDDGYTAIIIHDTLLVTKYPEQPIIFNKGEEKDLIELAEKFK